MTYDGKDSRIQISNLVISNGSLEIKMHPLEVGDYAVNFELDLFSSGDQQTLNSISQSFEVYANTDVDALALNFQNKLFISQMSLDDPSLNKFEFSWV